jgi:hypothetical protein
MRLQPRHAPVVSSVVALAVALAGGVGCAKDATEVLIVVDADTAVAPILILRTSIGMRYDPSHVAGSERSSPYASDATDRPGPFVFPLSLPETIDPSYAGLVDVTVEGLDWDTHAIIASGTTAGAVVPQKTTTASLTLTPKAQPGAGADGGVD